MSPVKKIMGKDVRAADPACDERRQRQKGTSRHGCYHGLGGARCKTLDTSAKFLDSTSLYTNNRIWEISSHHDFMVLDWRRTRILFLYQY